MERGWICSAYGKLEATKASDGAGSEGSKGKRKTKTEVDRQDSSRYRKNNGSGIDGVCKGETNMKKNHKSSCTDLIDITLILYL